MAKVSKEEYVFECKDDLVNYLYSILTNPTQVKIQKTLYLLYAFYGATYGQFYNQEQEGKEDFGEQSYPKHLFEANFQAWRYGPVEYDVYCREKNGGYEAENQLPINLETHEKNNIKQFIDDLVSQTDKIDDFSLVDRTYQDNVWLDNYREGEQYIEIKNEEIIKEYQERYIVNDI